MTDTGKARLIVQSEQPFNAEPPLDLLRQAFLTPQVQFYVRSHGEVPEIDADAYRLRVEGEGVNGLELGLADLRARFPRRTVTASLQCAGNRRRDLQAVGKTSGDPWDAGAIGNGAWSGAALSEVLQAAGLADPGDLHVAFRCRDLCEADGSRQLYEVSIPARKAMAGEVLLASELNGEPLTPAHGFPLRVVVPGYAGVRSAKWLDRITVQAAPSGAHWQARDYRLFPPGVSEEQAVPETGMSINEMPLNSAICDPVRGGVVQAGRVPVRGYATASPRRIARVDVSPDGGRTWRDAVLLDTPADPWSWTFWEAELDLAPGAHELVVRAVDGAGQVQPSRPEEVWNFKGYLSTAWHRVRVTAV